jgi:hypothetical protein
VTLPTLKRKFASIGAQSNVAEYVVVSAVRFPAMSDSVEKGLTEYIFVDQGNVLALLSNMAEVESKLGRVDDHQDPFVESSRPFVIVTCTLLDEGIFPTEMIDDANGPIATNNHLITMHALMMKCLFRKA